jgi:hypothetical protein
LPGMTFDPEPSFTCVSYIYKCSIARKAFGVNISQKALVPFNSKRMGVGEDFCQG